ncbi:MAG: Eco57I restriction-modification methylase domain-containing protein [Thermomonas sp.]
MDLLFDSLGPNARAADVSAALDALAAVEESERGAVFTRPEVVAAILDLAGYTVDRPLQRMRLLEPSFGEGDFLLPALDRLLAAYFQNGGLHEEAAELLGPALRGVELHRGSVEHVRKSILAKLEAAGIDGNSAKGLCDEWLLTDDFLLCSLPGEFDVVVGNPPYVRQERIPAALLAEYRRRYRTLYDRADLYIPFYERALDLLAQRGRLGFICANRWIKNRYGTPLREKVTTGFWLEHYIDMEGIDAFHSQVMAYPAITIISRATCKHSPPTRVACVDSVRRFGLGTVAAAMQSKLAAEGVEDIALAHGDEPWLLDDLPRLHLLRRLEAEFPSLEDAGCKVGIGVATGCDRVFIGDFDALPVEDARKLPLVLARDLVDGGIAWSGKGVVNPFENDGRLATLDDNPRFAAYLQSNREAVANRHVATRNPAGWYRTIDRITPSLLEKPKLLVPDIKGEAVFVLDEGRYYPHHNLYYITSENWDLRALRTILRSSLSLMIVSTYCTRMAGGFLRFQAQYLRRLRLPRWEALTESQRAALRGSDTETNINVVDSIVFAVFSLNDDEGRLARSIADRAQVTGRKEKELM